MKKKSRKEREYLQRRNEILNASLTLFSQKGYYNVSMSEIAAKSEFSVGTIYNFFPNKEALYCTLLTEKLIYFHKYLKSALEKPGNEIQKIKSWISEKIRLFYENIDYIKLYFSETMDSRYNINKEVTDEIKKHRKIILNSVKVLFSEGIKKKKIIETDPYLLAVAIDGMCNALLYETLENPDNGKIETSTILNIFFLQIYQKGAMVNA